MVTSGINRYLLDTSVFVDYLRQAPIARKIIFDTRSVNAAYSVITEAELWAGITRFRTEKQHILVLRPFQRYFVNVSIARRSGQLLALIRSQSARGTSLPGLSDCIIASTAEYYDLTVYTRNSKHFAHFTNYGIKTKFYTL